MADRLVVVDDGRYRIQWLIADGDNGEDLGAYLGQESKEPPEDFYKSVTLDRDYWAAERAGFQVIRTGNPDTCGHDSTGFWWESKTQAANALTKVKALMRASLSAIPWPEWAVKAAEAGWKPPKGWKP